MLYLFTQLAPMDKNLTFKLTNSANPQEITFNYDVKAKQWLANERGAIIPLLVDKKQQTFKLDTEKFNINELVENDTKINWKKTTSVSVPTRQNMLPQAPIIIKRTAKAITFSQKEGDMSDLQEVTISWAK